MGFFRTQTATLDGDDASLVMMALGGDRDAFSEIVRRYQNLLCSLAYSSVGDVKHSEDIAQETFVEAWKKLDSLREPQKLKSWLCGILRFKVNHHYRKQVKQPVSIEDETAATESQAVDSGKLEDAAISEQQQTLLWKALDNMDDIYREPLVLFYRQDHSVENVAAQLDLTEDTVKQRLSRGRKLLQKSVETIVEEVLEHTKPGAAFTAAVLTAVNNIPAPAHAAALGAGAIKTGSFFQLATLVALLATVSGFISGLFGLRASLDQSRTQKERRNVIQLTAMFMLFAIAYVAGVFVLRALAIGDAANAEMFAVASHGLVIIFIFSYAWLTWKLLHRTRNLRAQERLSQPEAFTAEVDQVDSKQREYKSSWQLFGIPLLHFRFGMPEQGDKPVKGWIAGGETAYGVLFAWGAVAVAPISVGIISFGILSVGVIGVGIIGLGTVGMGLIGFGASAVAYKAYGSLSALGWESAFSNGFSAAFDAAIAPVAHAAQTNNEAAAEISNLAMLDQTYVWALAAISVLVIVPSALYAKTVRKRMGQNL